MKIPAKGFTHGGKFHADDVFATALLMIVRPDIKVTRGFVVPDGFDGIFEWFSALIGTAAFIALFHYKAGIVAVISVCALAGLSYSLLLG